jgi:hypothetical protein
MILIRSDSNLTSKQTPKLDVFGKTLTCTYYKSGERTVLATSQSLVVDSYKGHRAYASIIITCPNAPPNQTPNHQWDRISLDLLPVQEGDSRDNNGSLDRSRPGSQFSSPNLDASITYSSTTTGAFPVCHLPAYTTQAKKHKLSICTTINAVDNTAELIEWIEFHLMRGVDHIFLYNTALIPRVQLLVNATLSGYVEKGLITIVPWFYENCVKGMASGRSIEIILDDFPAWSSRYVKDNPDQKANSTSFLPPKPIAQTAALGSCYSRFRHTSEYIMHIDVDEFVLSRETSLPMFAEKLFKKSPHSVALSIAPVMMVDCNSTARGGDGLSQTDRKLLIQRLSRVAQAKDNLTATGAPSRPIQSRSIVLPRLGTWQYAFAGYSFEPKLIMRTDSVDNFFIHYISQVNPQKKGQRPLSVDPQKAAVFHFKEYKSFLYSGFLDLNTSRYGRHPEFYDGEGEEKARRRQAIGYRSAAERLYEINTKMCDQLCTFTSLESRGPSSGDGTRGAADRFTDHGLTSGDYSELSGRIERSLAEIKAHRGRLQSIGISHGLAQEQHDLREDISALLDHREEQWLKKAQLDIISANFVFSAVPKVRAFIPMEIRLMPKKDADGKLIGRGAKKTKSRGAKKAMP